VTLRVKSDRSLGVSLQNCSFQKAGKKKRTGERIRVFKKRRGFHHQLGGSKKNSVAWGEHPILSIMGKK